MSANTVPERRLPVWAHRWLVNLGLFLGVTLVYSLVSSLIAAFTWVEDFPPGLILYGWLLTSYMLFPGTLLYLGLLELLPTAWSKGSRRGLAIALSPLAAMSLWFFLGPSDEYLSAWQLTLVTPLVYGAAVLLRPSTA